MSDRIPTSIDRFVKVAKIMPAWRSILLRGRHGIGKSEVVFQIGEDLKLPVIDRRLSQMSEGDIIGLPKLEDGATRFYPPDWFLRACNEPVVLFLDEINRATPEVNQAAFQIVLSHEMNGFKLHPQTRVFAAVNDSADYQVNEMDPAMLDRFSVYDLEPTFDDWVAWAERPVKVDGKVVRSQRVDPIIVEFLKKNLDHFEETKVKPGHVTPSRRSWGALNEALYEAKLELGQFSGQAPPDIIYTLACGMIGIEATTNLIKFVENYQFQVQPNHVFDEFDKSKTKIKRLTDDAHNGLISKIGKYLADKSNPDLTAAQVENLSKYVDMLKDEQVISMWTAVSTSQRNATIVAVHKRIGQRVVESVKAGQAAQAKDK